MKINLMHYRNLKDVINRFVQKEHDSYGNKLNWPTNLDRLHIRVSIYEDMLSDHLYNNKPDTGFYILHHNPGTIRDELIYGEFFNQCHTISNILEGGYELEFNETAVDYNYDEYI